MIARFLKQLQIHEVCCLKAVSQFLRIAAYVASVKREGRKRGGHGGDLCFTIREAHSLVIISFISAVDVSTRAKSLF